MASSDRLGGDVNPVVPFLTTLAVPRCGDDVLPGRYCDEQEVWVVGAGAGAVPIVESNAAGLHTVTKTKVQLERDDETGFELLEGVTKTLVVRERDDAPGSTSFLPELATKTDVVRERDD